MNNMRMSRSERRKIGELVDGGGASTTRHSLPRSTTRERRLQRTSDKIPRTDDTNQNLDLLTRSVDILEKRLQNPMMRRSRLAVVVDTIVLFSSNGEYCLVRLLFLAQFSRCLFDSFDTSGAPSFFHGGVDDRFTSSRSEVTGRLDTSFISNSFPDNDSPLYLCLLWTSLGKRDYDDSDIGSSSTVRHVEMVETQRLHLAGLIASGILLDRSISRTRLQIRRRRRRRKTSTTAARYVHRSYATSRKTEQQSTVLYEGESVNMSADKSSA